MFLEDMNKHQLLRPSTHPSTLPELPPYPAPEQIKTPWRDRFFLGSGQFFITLGSALKEKARVETAVSPLSVSNNLPCDA
jgi:hypothetical protein